MWRFKTILSAAAITVASAMLPLETEAEYPDSRIKIEGHRVTIIDGFSE